MALTVTIGQLPNHHACAFQNNTDPLRVPESPEENRVLGILNNQLSETQAQLNTVSLQIDQWETMQTIFRWRKKLATAITCEKSGNDTVSTKAGIAKKHPTSLTSWSET